MLFIYTNQVTNRLQYVADWMMTHLLQGPYRLTDRQEDLPSGGFVINYSHRQLEGAQIHLPPHGLLFESGVQALNSRQEDLYRFFSTSGDLPYDPFALAFFMLSRYEEYLPFQADVHGRFPASASAAARQGLLGKPIADLAALDLRNLIGRLQPELCTPIPARQHSFTFDLDAPFAFRGKGALRLAGGAARELVRGKWQALGRRLSFLSGRSPDPFDIFEDLAAGLAEQGFRATGFLLLEHRGANNPAAPYTDRRFREIVERWLAAGHRLGLHPSYDAHKPGVLERETQRFRELTGQLPACARMHFLCLKLPDTYRMLEAAGIREDHSMAYPDRPGFRAGTARSFYFFDLENDRQTALEIHPYCLMDATFEYYGNRHEDMGFEEAAEKLEAALLPVGGTLGTIWHNDLLSGFASRHPWPQTYARMLGRAQTPPGGHSRANGPDGGQAGAVKRN